ncbi:NAD(P)H-dependent glycerol-3-phosphate dehydrogenase [Candidatus Omnitrophus magneticus]|uniref:Glycerol-3-phosphate dehydrogenase [NAD(P)+] n=1 Tax=Candidatus Omnitrophus magneticus TaxID=1609969 RepID=A0A0F0CPN4_9BACT|nr:NAD(P)H-dependent glycerol-3-phosphate dehydrogenase [Candidatus Omnitrophus magneticus]
MEQITIIGDGGWGTALAILLNKKGIKTLLWSYSPVYAEYLNKTRENTKFLKGVKIPFDIEITSDIETASCCNTVIFAVPCEYAGKIAEQFKNASFKTIVSATKGIEKKTFKRPSEILSENFTNSKIFVLSGPSISSEVASFFPASVVLAGESDTISTLQALLTAPTFRVYASNDIIGVELGGALKNVIAIAAGISDGLGFGANAKASILTRGLVEIARLGVKMGARRETFSGLSGIGDLATTCISPFSRNRTFGEEVGKGLKAEDIIKRTEMAIEGVGTAKSAYELSLKYQVDMPITSQIYKIIYEGKNPRKAVSDLMTRELKKEDYF